jgi:1-acyl-sn-glycerol-3-phosphate acyltransferase
MGWFITLSVVIILVIYCGQKASKVDWGGPAVNWVDGLVRLVCKYLHRLPPTELALPKTGAAIVVANHVSGLDPFLLIAACRRPLRFLIAREEYERPFLHWLFKASGCIPVDRGGKPEQALRQALRALKEGEVVAIFPHGTIHLDSDPPKKIKGGVARLAAWSEAAIYPIRIDGVGGQGQVVLAPIIPSHAILSLKEIHYCQPEQLTECLAYITKAIETPVMGGD